MKTHESSTLEWSEDQAADFHSEQIHYLNIYHSADNRAQHARNQSLASNDADYSIKASPMPQNHELPNQDEWIDQWPDVAADTVPAVEKGYKKTPLQSVKPKLKSSEVTVSKAKSLNPSRDSDRTGSNDLYNGSASVSLASASPKSDAVDSVNSHNNDVHNDNAHSRNAHSKKANSKNAYSGTVYEENGRRNAIQNNNAIKNNIVQSDQVLERVFMNGLIKHTVIALAIIIPLAAFSAYAAPSVLDNATIAKTTSSTKTTDKISTATLAVEPSSIIHKSASKPTTVDSVDLKKYAGKWYEIGRLPMYFQRNCASNVTATYTEKSDGSGINVLNQCTGSDGAAISAEGLAKPADDTGSKLKVTFLPSWIRWLPVGRADYWVLARDPNYQTALVGTPDREYLWLLARSPNITQETYAKYRKIAQEQGYNLKEFKLTNQNNQNVNLVP